MMACFWDAGKMACEIDILISKARCKHGPEFFEKPDWCCVQLALFC